MKVKELNDNRKKSVKELEKMLAKNRDELNKIKIDLSLGKESNLKKASNLRKDIAQILTIIKEKELVKEQRTGQEKGEDK